MTEQAIHWKYTHESYVATHEGYTIEISRDLQENWSCYIWEGPKKVANAGGMKTSDASKQKAANLVKALKS